MRTFLRPPSLLARPHGSGRDFASRLGGISLIAVALGLSGCAFDISTVKLLPATFTPGTTPAEAFQLREDVKVGLGTGFPTHLKAGTHWQAVGRTEAGAVFSTRDQIVTVEASNTYEAQLVISNRCLTGFYLPVDHKLAPVSRPLPLPVDPLTTQTPNPP